MSQESLNAFLAKEEEGKVTIDSWFDEQGILQLSFSFDDEEAGYLADLLIDCMQELVPEVKKRHEQKYEGSSLADSLLDAAGEEGE